MKVIGLTGVIGAGKSVATDLLRQRAIPVIDTDDLAREVVEPGQPALQQIRESFGSDFIAADGSLDRGRMAQRVFEHPEDRRKLEAIVHPPVRELWRLQVDKWRGEGKTLAVVVIPLLLETHAEREFDSIICVVCSPKTQHQRLLARGWSPEQILNRLAAQWPLEKKIAASDFVIWSEPTTDLLAEQLDRILRVISGSESHLQAPSGG